MDNYKLLLMVISSNTYPAKRNSKTQQKIYKNKNNDFKAYWYKGIEKSEQLPNSFKLNNEDLILNCSDDSRQMGQKLYKHLSGPFTMLIFSIL